MAARLDSRDSYDALRCQIQAADDRLRGSIPYGHSAPIPISNMSEAIHTAIAD